MDKHFRNDKTLSDIVGKLRSHFHPTKIYLFGSRAVGTAREGSDYDLLLILKHSEKSSRERKRGLPNTLGNQCPSRCACVY